MITSKDAIKIIKNEFPDKIIVECLEFKDFFAFALVNHELDKPEMFGGGYDTVDKQSGKLSVFNPTRNLKEYIASKVIKF